jgi:glycosyltransferase involved in cell wall biosynthesis
MDPGAELLIAAAPTPQPMLRSGRTSNGTLLRDRQAASRVRVCQLLHSLTVGGAELLAGSIARELKQEFDFVFVCLDALGEVGAGLKRDGFAVHVLDRKGGLDLACGRNLRSILRQDDICLVHAHQYTPFFYATLARGLGSNPPLLFTEHGRHFPDCPSWKRRLYNRFCMRRGDRAVAVGRAVQNALVDNEGIPPRRIDVVYNGVDIHRFFAATPPTRRAARAEMGLSETDFVVIQVARLDYLKDHATALHALEQLLAKEPRARLVLVGDGPERDSIEQQIERSRLTEHVRLLGVRYDIEQLLAGADAFLLSSISEGIPVTLIEAMAARLPVVATDVGGVSEVVEDGRTGLLAPARSSEQLAAALVRLAESRQLRQELGARGLERALQLFSARQMHDAYAGIYRDMTAGKK